MPPTVDEIIAQVQHSAGTFEREALLALASYAAELRPEHSAETGCGLSTLLLSHASRDHRVFTVDCGDGSLAAVLNSPLLNKAVVTFVLGPTQLTLPRYSFDARFQLVVLDGPHGWPFPDLEYYYFYPRIEAGGLLVVDDIQIRSIRRMFEILEADAMWRLDEVVGNTAFFRRTDAPTFCPTGDGWWEQGYNLPSSA